MASVDDVWEAGGAAAFASGAAFLQVLRMPPTLIKSILIGLFKYLILLKIPNRRSLGL